MGTLIISKAAKKPLTKNQAAFNKLTERIEKLHKEIAKKNQQYERAVHIYNTVLMPLRTKYVDSLRQVFDILWDNYKNKKLPKADLRVLKKILQNDLQKMFAIVQPDDNLKKIFQELEGETFEHAMKREKSSMFGEMQEMFEELDIEVDLENVTDEEEIMRRMFEAQAKMEEREQNGNEKKQARENNKRKTPKQLEKEVLQKAAEELKHKNISTIYRQLAKLFHPDLEQDEEKRAEKEILMKQLTAAYEARNLHELLSLELKWIHKENGHLESLTEEKLDVYLVILREQVKDLESQKYQVFYQPRFQVLMQQFGMNLASGDPLKKLELERMEVEDEIDAYETEARLFRLPNNLVYIKRMIKDFKDQQQHSEEDDLLDFLMSMQK